MVVCTTVTNKHSKKKKKRDYKKLLPPSVRTPLMNKVKLSTMDLCLYTTLPTIKDYKEKRLLVWIVMLLVCK